MKRRRLYLALACLLVSYVGSYLVLRTTAYRWADQHDLVGFYFVAPSTPARYHCHDALVKFYYPLIWIDLALGTGRHPASEPMWRLSQALPETGRNARPAA